MKPPTINGLVHVGLDVLKTTVNKATRKILVQLGDVVAQTVDSDGNELVQHYGFFSRAPKPKPGKAATQATVIRTSDRDIIIGTQDLRGLELYGEAEDGDAGIYSAGEDGKGQARVLCKKDGSIHLYTRKGNTPDGTGMTVQVDAQGGAIRAVNDSGFGLIIDADGVKLTAGNASLSLNADGSFSLIGTKASVIDAAPVCIGGATNPATDAVCCGPTGVASAARPKLLVGAT